jgi:hypothetical protein
MEAGHATRFLPDSKAPNCQYGVRPVSTNVMRGSAHTAGLAVAGCGLLLILLFLVLLATEALVAWSLAGFLVGAVAAGVPTRGSQ